MGNGLEQMPQTPDRISPLPALLQCKSRGAMTACSSVARCAAGFRFEHGQMRALEVSFAEGNVARIFRRLGRKRLQQISREPA